MEKKKFVVEGMTCSACVSHVNKAVCKVKGVKDVNVNLLTKSMDVEIEDLACIDKINEAVSKAGYKSYLKDEENKENLLSERNSTKYQEWRNMVLVRDGECQCCGYNKHLHVHHIFGFKKYPKLR